MKKEKKKYGGYRNLHIEKSDLLRHREWRGFRDTMYDYYRWLVTWKDMIKMVLGDPVAIVRGLWRYRWMSSYLSIPHFIDGFTEGRRGAALRVTHLHYNTIVKNASGLILREFAADERFRPGNKRSKKIVCVDELVPIQFMAGFPNLEVVPVQTMPIFLSSMVDQQIVPPYVDAVENYGVPADVCPLPSAEAGVAIEDDFPKVGCCMISCNMPCDGSVMTNAFQDRRFKLPTHVYNVPLRYNEEGVQQYAVNEIKEMIKFVEEQTGEKFDEKAFLKAMDVYNQQLDCDFHKWDIQKTDCPQLTYPSAGLYRTYSYHLSGGTDKRFLKTDKKVWKIIEKSYAKRTKVIKEMRHRTLVWSCPANYYMGFAGWLENTWGCYIVMDMETLVSAVKFRTDSIEHALEDLAMTYERATMRKHTKGGYPNVLDELWRVVEEYKPDTVIMYDQISCKGMDGLLGMFEDQARERNINFIWVSQDLMDYRTITRRDMREQVNKYMTTVLQEKPIDERMLEFDDSLAW